MRLQDIRPVTGKPGTHFNMVRRQSVIYVSEHNDANGRVPVITVSAPVIRNHHSQIHSCQEPNVKEGLPLVWNGQ